MSLFGRARTGLNLSPMERAVLRLLEGLGVAALVAGLQAALPVLTSQDPAAVSWPAVVHTFLAAALVALLLALLKYSRAWGDPPLPAPGAAPPAGR